MPELTDRQRQQLEGIDAEARRVMRDHRGEGEPIGARLAPLFMRRLEIPGEREQILRDMGLPPGLYHISSPLEQIMIRFAETARVQS